MSAKISSGGPFETRAEHLRHHAAQARHDDAAEGGQAVVRVLERRQVHHQDPAVQHDVPHVDVPAFGTENVPKRSAELLEDTGKVANGVAVLLGRLVAALFTDRNVWIIAGQLTEIGEQRVCEIFRHVAGVDLPDRTGVRVGDAKFLLLGGEPDPRQLGGAPNHVDVEQDALVVPHPHQHWRERADQRYRVGAEHAVLVLLRRLTQLADEQFAQRVGVAGRERVEARAVAATGRDHEVDREHVVLTAEAPRKGEDLSVELVLGLAIDDHEPASVGQRVRQQRQDRGGFAGAGGAGDRGVLTRVLVGDPELLPGEGVLAEINRPGRLARFAILRVRVVPVLPLGAPRQTEREYDPTGQHPGGIERADRDGELDRRRIEPADAPGRH